MALQKLYYVTCDVCGMPVGSEGDIQDTAASARRIARTAREYAGHRDDVKLHFDADGQLLDAHPAQLSYGRRPAWADDVVATVIAGYGRKMSQRAAQDLLDARAAYDPDSGMYLDGWIGFYLRQLEDAREIRH